MERREQMEQMEQMEQREPLYLSQLRLRTMSRDVQRDLANCDNMHRRLLSVFPDMPEITRARDQFGLLYRVEMARNSPEVLVQSRARPDWSRLPGGYLREPDVPVKQIDALYAALENGQTLIFRLRANPTRRISNRSQTQPERWRGKRVELRKQEEQLAWLKRKGETAGFALLGVRAVSSASDLLDIPDVRTLHTADLVTGRNADRRLTFGSVLFEGRLHITDAVAFRQALVVGVGSGKAYGFGLLSIAPVRAAI